MANSVKKTTETPKPTPQATPKKDEKSVKVVFITRFIGTIGSFCAGDKAEITSSVAENLEKHGLVKKC